MPPLQPIHSDKRRFKACSCYDSKRAHADGDMTTPKEKEDLPSAAQVLDSLTVAACNANVPDAVWAETVVQTTDSYPFDRHVRTSRLLRARPYPMTGLDYEIASRKFDRRRAELASQAAFAQKPPTADGAKKVSPDVLRRLEDILQELQR